MIRVISAIRIVLKVLRTEDSLSSISTFDIKTWIFIGNRSRRTAVIETRFLHLYPTVTDPRIRFFLPRALFVAGGSLGLAYKRIFILRTLSFKRNYTVLFLISLNNWYKIYNFIIYIISIITNKKIFKKENISLLLFVIIINSIYLV